MTDNSIQKSLEQDARRVRARMPEKLTAAEIEKLSKSLVAFMAENDFTRAQVARWIGYSPTVVYDFCRGTYQGNIEKVANKIVNLMNSVDRKARRIKNRRFVSTTVAIRIGTLITQTEAFCDDEGKIGLIIGDGGHGKSHCLRQYAKSDRNSVYVELDDTMTSTRMFAEIAKLLKVDSSGSLALITERLVEALRNRHIIIMLDEASGLTVKQLNQLRQIIVVKAKCPLILAGNGDLLKTINQPTTRRGHESLDQFRSRLMGALNLDELASDNDGGLYTVADIRELYEYGGIRLASDAVATLRRICKAPRTGRLRTCSHIIAALHTARVIREKGVIDAAAIVSAIEQLRLPVRVWLPLASSDILDDSGGERSVSATG